MPKGKMDEKAAERIRKARGDKVRIYPVTFLGEHTTWSPVC